MAATVGEMRRLRPAVVLFGDSITQQALHWDIRGWALQLSAWFGVTADVLVRGQSGYNTRQALQLLTDRPEPWNTCGRGDGIQEVAMVTIFFGANDAAFAGDQYVPLDEYKENLATLIERLRSCNGQSCQIVVITPPPLDDERWHCARREKFAYFNPDASKEDIEAVPLDRKHAFTEQYASAAVEVAAAHDALHVDLYHGMMAYAAKNQLEQVNDGAEEAFRSQSAPEFAGLLSDGLHLSAEGNDFVFGEITAVLAEHRRSLLPDSIGMDFLAWAEYKVPA